MTPAETVIRRAVAFIRAESGPPITIDHAGDTYAVTCIVQRGPVAQLTAERVVDDEVALLELFIDPTWASMTLRGIRRGIDLTGLIVPEHVADLFHGPPRSTYSVMVADAIRTADRAGARYRELVCEARLMAQLMQRRNALAHTESAEPCWRALAVRHAARNLERGWTLTGALAAGEVLR